MTEVQYFVLGESFGQLIDPPFSGPKTSRAAPFGRQWARVFSHVPPPPQQRRLEVEFHIFDATLFPEPTHERTEEIVNVGDLEPITAAQFRAARGRNWTVLPKVGDPFLVHDAGGVTFGVLTDRLDELSREDRARVNRSRSHIEDSDFAKYRVLYAAETGNRRARLFSARDPDGEQADLHEGRITRSLSRAEFEAARARCWEPTRSGPERLLDAEVRFFERLRDGERFTSEWEQFDASYPGVLKDMGVDAHRYERFWRAMASMGAAGFAHRLAYRLGVGGVLDVFGEQPAKKSRVIATSHTRTRRASCS